MSRTSSLSGLGRGRARGRRDIAEGKQLAERRPGRSRAEDWEGELAGFQSEAGSQWIAMEDSAPSPYLGYSYALQQKIVLRGVMQFYRLVGKGESSLRSELPATDVW